MTYLLILGYCLPTIICLFDLTIYIIKIKLFRSEDIKNVLYCFIPIVNFWVALWCICGYSILLRGWMVKHIPACRYANELLKELIEKLK